MMLRHIVLASAFVLSAAIPASAAGDNVVLIAVGKVHLPSSLPGLCQLHSTVTQVWDGKAFHPGQALTLKVPCGRGNSYMTPVNMVHGHGVHLFAVDILLKSKQGLARIDDAGALVWQPSGRSYGPWGMADGYRVLDGALVPAMPERLSP